MRTKAPRPEPKRGKGRPQADLDDVFRKIEPFLKAGCSINQACAESGVTKTVVYDYNAQDREFAEKIESAMEHARVLAQSVVYDALKQHDVGTAKWLLERRDPRYKEKKEIRTDKIVAVDPLDVQGLEPGNDQT